METKMLKTTTLADSTNLPTMMAGRGHRSQVNPSTSGVFEWGEEIFRAVLEYRENIKLFILQLIAIWLVVEPTHLKNMIVKMGKSSPIFGMKIKNIWNHHLVFILQFYSYFFLVQETHLAINLLPAHVHHLDTLQIAIAIIQELLAIFRFRDVCLGRFFGWEEPHTKHWSTKKISLP